MTPTYTFDPKRKSGAEDMLVEKKETVKK